MSTEDTPVTYPCSTDQSVSQAVTAAVARAAGCDQIQLDPLYEYVDPDAIDAIIPPRSNSAVAQSDVSIEFTYTTYRVTVTTGCVHVSELEEERDG